jgi:hypothetical protein
LMYFEIDLKPAIEAHLQSTPAQKAR